MYRDIIEQYRLFLFLDNSFTVFNDNTFIGVVNLLAGKIVRSSAVSIVHADVVDAGRGHLDGGSLSAQTTHCIGGAQGISTSLAYGEGIVSSVTHILAVLEDDGTAYLRIVLPSSALMTGT